MIPSKAFPRLKGHVSAIASPMRDDHEAPISQTHLPLDPRAHIPHYPTRCRHSRLDVSATWTRPWKPAPHDLGHQTSHLSRDRLSPYCPDPFDDFQEPCLPEQDERPHQLALGIWPSSLLIIDRPGCGVWSRTGKIVGDVNVSQNTVFGDGKGRDAKEYFRT